MSIVSKAFRKLLGKKSVWRMFRKMIRGINPGLYDNIRELVSEAEEFASIGADKRQYVLDELGKGVKGWLTNIFIEFVVGELIENGKPRYLNLLNKIK